MVIAGGSESPQMLRRRGRGFNGAGDGDRRRAGLLPSHFTWLGLRFNGAGDGDRRRGASMISMLFPAPSFNGAGDGDRRRGSRASRSGVARGCFNGAGDGDRRRERAGYGDPPRPRDASTEPAMVIAGGPGTRSPGRGGRRCFNGAGDGDRRRAVPQSRKHCADLNAALRAVARESRCACSIGARGRGTAR